MKKYRNDKEWRKLFGEQKRGGLSAKEFCRSKGINANVYYRKKKSLAVEIGLVRLPVKLERSRSIEVTISGVTVGFDGGELVRVLCWAHARRMFVKAWDVAKSPEAKEAIGVIRELFDLEDKRKEHSLKGFAKQRANKAGLIFDRFKPWLEKLVAETLSSGALAKAAAYSLSNWDGLIRYVEDPLLTPSNNRAENAIRPFVIGRNYAESPIMLSA